MKKRLVIFAKAPRLGQVKSRLAADIGLVGALRFQAIALDRMVRRLASNPRWETLLAVTGGPFRWPMDVRRMEQPRGDLGQRMDKVMRGFGPGPVVIVGSDVPDISPHHIDEAFRILGRRDAVFGPADDGGYWLVGLRRRPAHPALFAPVRWSTEFALADTVANLKGRYDHQMLETLIDVDDGGSLRRWRERNLGGLSGSTRRD
ncbi:MAG: DUF2064 domain-containing protein [Alphaproteobacteria bacterium]|nr:DUF2064 domain-containing protein [Alphaproteobacteria bacterium]